jgi:D-tyrosyl-tRNA(Tyr) deacylase
MRVLVQRVKEARVSAKGNDIARIGPGLLLLVGIGKDDRTEDIEWMVKKMASLRIFEDERGKMNLNIAQIKGKILSVPQFTLYADTHKGNRPGFDASAEPQIAKEYWQKFNTLLQERGTEVKEGNFGAHMAVSLINDGPVTLWLDSKQRR